MYTKQIAIITAAFAAQAAAQEPLSPPVIVGEPPVVVETTTQAEIAQERYDAALARQRLGIAPLVLPEPAPGTVEKTTTTTKVETPGLPTRIYQTERNVVIVGGRELPYLTIPVLFKEGTAELLDEQSLQAIKDTAIAIKDVLIANPTAVFDVEGHTSTDGEAEMNLRLSADRARRIYTELIELHGIPTSVLAAHGYGENFPSYPGGSEEQMVLDRRVLVVRVK